MMIYTLWHAGDGDDLPWLVTAVDEYTVDENGGFPPEYFKRREDKLVRELILQVPMKAVSALFESPTVEATIIKEKAE
jgi:hypothetical protein